MELSPLHAWKEFDGRPWLLVHEYPWVRRISNGAGEVAQAKGLHDLGDVVTMTLFVLEWRELDGLSPFLAFLPSFHFIAVSQYSLISLLEKKR
jgi:hypothetical protein